jgi:hypothetical protein
MVIGLDSGGLSVMNCWNRDDCSVLYRDAPETSKWMNRKIDGRDGSRCLRLVRIVAGRRTRSRLRGAFDDWETAGVDRQQEICSTGVPLPCGLLHESAGLAVFDPAGTPVPAQFRVLERWRDAGEGRDDLSIRWLLVTFLADVPAGQHAVYRLKTGENAVPSEPLTIDEEADGYRMGGLLFRKDFTAPFALHLTDPDGKRIGTEDQQIQWSVWENGPVRACLRAESVTDHSRFGFIAWIYAYAGQKRWDMTVVLKNTPNEAQGPFYFRDFSVVWQPFEARTGRDFLLGGQWGRAVAGRIDGDQPVYLMQASDGTDRWDALGRQ